jgi:hypothetical protein
VAPFEEMLHKIYSPFLTLDGINAEKRKILRTWRQERRLALRGQTDFSIPQCLHFEHRDYVCGLKVNMCYVGSNGFQVILWLLGESP